MKKSGFLARMEAQKERENLATLRFTRQLITDVSVIALNSAVAVWLYAVAWMIYSIVRGE